MRLPSASGGAFPKSHFSVGYSAIHNYRSSVCLKVLSDGKWDYVPTVNTVEILEILKNL